MASFITKTSSGISIEFAPWTDDGKFLITTLHMKEELGGEIARGSIDLRFDATDEVALKYITEQNTGILRLRDEKENGLSYEIPVCIYSRNHILDSIHLELLCVPSLEFSTKKNTVVFDDINQAIEKLYPGNRDIRVSPDSGVDGIKEVQRCRSDYDFCNYLCKSFKKESVFSFGWEGLILKDRVGVNSYGNEEPDEKMLLLNGTQFTVISSQKMTYNSNLTDERKPFFPFENSEISLTSDDYSDREPKNVTSLMFGEEYHIVGREYAAHLENWKQNSKLLDSNLYYTVKIKGVDMPFYKIGDVIKLDRMAITEGDKESSNPFKNYIVKSNEVFYADDNTKYVDENGFKFSWTSLLIGLDKGDWCEIKKES